MEQNLQNNDIMNKIEEMSETGVKMLRFVDDIAILSKTINYLENTLKILKIRW